MAIGRSCLSFLIEGFPYLHLPEVLPGGAQVKVMPTVKCVLLHCFSLSVLCTYWLLESTLTHPLHVYELPKGRVHASWLTVYSKRGAHGLGQDEQGMIVVLMPFFFSRIKYGFFAQRMRNLCWTNPSRPPLPVLRIRKLRSSGYLTSTRWHSCLHED